MSEGGGRRTIVQVQQTISLLQGDALARPLVVRRETGRVCGLGHLAGEHLLQRVGALAVGVEDVHQMHCGGLKGDGDVTWVVVGTGRRGGSSCGWLRRDL